MVSFSPEGVTTLLARCGFGIMGLLAGIVEESPITSDSFVHSREKKKEAHGRITRASLQMNQIFVYLRDHLLIDLKLSMALL
jgi:hypothetical protein